PSFPTRRSSDLVAGNGVHDPSCIFSDSRSQKISTDQCAPSPYRVDYGRTCKIVKRRGQSIQKPATPLPHTYDGVADTHVQNGKEDKWPQLDPFCHRTGYNACSGGRKHSLKDKVGIKSISLTVVSSVAPFWELQAEAAEPKKAACKCLPGIHQVKSDQRIG